MVAASTVHRIACTQHVIRNINQRSRSSARTSGTRADGLDLGGVLSVAPSIIIPAYNEGSVIERCLNTLLEGVRDGEFEIVVVCNGCKDDTEARARKFESRGVRVLATQVASKANALNLGDQAVAGFPRVYLDADIQLDVESLRAVVEALSDDSPWLLAAPRPRVDLSNRSWGVRAFYAVWTELPYFNEGFVGSGVYAFSSRGRARFGVFPDIMTDDEFARRLMSPEERGNPERGSFVITPPKTLASLVHVATRFRAGNYELEDRFPELSTNKGTSPGRTLGIIARRPDLWLHAPIYLGVMALANVRARKQLRSRRARTWNRDETAREVTP
jgi:glycosyltransferase involved in cell wall biosynthesis